MGELLQGVVPALVTPTNESGGLAMERLPEIVERFMKAGVQGFLVTGTTGEWPLLTLEERRRVVEAAVRCVNGRVPAVAHVGALPVQDAVALAKHAERNGADGISAIPPYYSRFSEADILSYFRSIIEAVCDTGGMRYNPSLSLQYPTAYW